MPGRNAFSLHATTVTPDLPDAQKREHNRRWEGPNPARRYLISPQVRDEVVARAEALVVFDSAIAPDLDAFTPTVFEQACRQYHRQAVWLVSVCSRCI